MTDLETFKEIFTKWGVPYEIHEYGDKTITAETRTKGGCVTIITEYDFHKDGSHDCIHSYVEDN